ncbi:universal stress protein [Bacillus weihaiensis]|uniref:Universal stress protein n=1 Tax=Bacillus weihaiensis TaxID=1547283 RepID=A0A1L3MRS2_9BACI|nr:universal stress protein [Bacillus weihaiensis]APH05050.1 universal stress protein UspA [Bacillus weihaiensis]
MNMVYERILVAIDGSDESEWAFKKAVNIAKRNSAKLLICNVIDARELSGVTYGLYADTRLSKEAETYAHNLLEKRKQTAVEMGVEQVETLIKFGSPKTKISKEIAPEYDVDLIVCGATGMNTVERLMIGSVSENILRYATCDVLVVRTPKEEDV